MTLQVFHSRPTTIEAIHVRLPDSGGGRYDDGSHLIDLLNEISGHTETNRAPERWDIDPADGSVRLLAGKDGAQGWVPVPWGHWIVRNPGDPTDLWPVDDEVMQRKYERGVIHDGA